MHIVHYLNQFFAGLGGEASAGQPPFAQDGPIGPGSLLQRFLGDDGDVVGTVVCGDNYVSENSGSIAEILDLASSYNPDLIVAGPAFTAGRYGIACALVTGLAIQEGIQAITGMHPENPGVTSTSERIIVFSTSANATGMSQAIEGMLALGRKMVNSDPMGSAAEEGYISRGYRLNRFHARTGTERAIEQLLSKIAGTSYTTEVPLPTYEVVAPANLNHELSESTIALVTEGSLVPKGNPDGLESFRGRHWFTYSLEDLESFGPDSFETVHGGFDNTLVNEAPDRVLPLDVMRELESDGLIGSLHNQYYVTTGNMTTIAESEKIGKEIAEEVRYQDVHGVLVTST